MTPTATKQRKNAGLSILEVLVVVAAVSVAAVITIPMVSNIRENVKASKLNTEIASLNNAVRAYLTAGGEIQETDTAFDVLELLKAEMSEEDAIHHVGFTGSHIDQRTKAKTIDEDTPGTRVVWDYGAKRFVKTEQLMVGISEFYLDNNCRKTDYFSNRSVTLSIWNR